MISNISMPVKRSGELLHIANDIPEQTISDELRTFLDAPKLINHRGASVVRSGWVELIAQDECDLTILSAYQMEHIGRANLAPRSAERIVQAILGQFKISSVRQSLSRLVDAGWLESKKLSGDKVKLLLQQKGSVFHPFFHANCEWCNCTTIATQQHHYPIPRSKGGTETVSICANCHFEFHQMVEVPTYEPTQALIAFFETPLSKAYEMGGV